MSVTPDPDVARIQRALAGDAAAIAELIDAVAAVIQRRAYAALIRGRRGARDLGAEVEDLCQDVLAMLFADEGRVLLSWDPARGLSLKGFVGLVAQRHVLTVLRSRQRSPFSADPTDPMDLDVASGALGGADAHDSAAARETLDLLALRLRQRLTPAGLEMFYRLFVWEKSPEEIGQETGQSLESIYQWRSRIRRSALEVQTELEAERATSSMKNLRESAG